MKWNRKHFVFCVCICVAFALFGAFVGVASAATGHVKEWGSVGSNPAPEEEWDRTFGGSGLDRGYSVQQTSDGGYIIVGETYSYGAGESAVWLIKTDSHGNKEWAMTIGGSNLDKGYSVEQTSDGGHIIVGETYSSGTGDGDVWLIKITPPSEKEAPGFEAIFAIAGLVVLAYFLKRRKLNNG